jgi:type IV pilus assembly protein PilP
MRSLAAIALVVVACSNNDPLAGAPENKAAAVSPTPAPAAATPAPVSREPESGAVDSAHTRDPFLPGAALATPPIPEDRDVARKAKRFTLDDLKLVAIVAGDGAARAMLVDPRGKGWVVTRGDRVGKPEITDHVVGWRVEKVRESDVVFVRDDSARPDRETEKRVIALRADAPAIDFVDD